MSIKTQQMLKTLVESFVGVMLRFLWKLEEKFFQAIVRVCRGEYSVKITDIKILHESPSFIVVDKHHDVIINTVSPNQLSLERQLERLYPDLVNKKLPFGFYFAHRLDYATSGIICIAKNKKACGAIGKVFEQRKTKKFYLAILRGHLPKDFQTIDERIGKDTREKFDGVRMAAESMPHCAEETRQAITHLIVLERGTCYGYPATKVLLRPITGRRHQLRIHCHTIGHTIVGDFTYSNRRDCLPYRMFLHAYKLEFDCRLEILDITSEDPFTSSNPKNKWESHQEVLSIPDAIYELAQK